MFIDGADDEVDRIMCYLALAVTLEFETVVERERSRVVMSLELESQGESTLWIE